MAAEVRRRDGFELQLRVGLGSGRVIAGEIGSGSLGYAATGETVGLAQRMESAAPPGAVMVSESTARLVEHTVTSAEPERVHIKGGDEPVRARRLLAITPRPLGRTRRGEPGRRTLGVCSPQRIAAGVAVPGTRPRGRGATRCANNGRRGHPGPPHVPVIRSWYGRSHQTDAVSLPGCWLRGLLRRIPNRTPPHRAVPGQQHLGVEQAERGQAAHAAVLVVIEQVRQQLRSDARQ